MKAKEYRKMASEELNKEVDTITKGLFNLRFRKVTDVVENPAAFKQQKKEIARIKTILREREIESQKEKSVAVAGKKS
ncbi:MAG: 50S ribosomal protein L29 [Planctomycetes bacterium RBG_16_59_8]|nr:MAG: 50S ribosomal protein L29 [Planctomycetes bacterium RBG_16_59_8]